MSGRIVANTAIETESTADILGAKLVHRMCAAGVVEPRDLFDLVAAETDDPQALWQAVGILSALQQAEISASLAMLPKRWESHSDKPLCSSDGAELQVDAEAIRDLLERIGREHPHRPPWESER